MSEPKHKARAAKKKTAPSKAPPEPPTVTPGDYEIDQQIGLLIRRAHQRASAIFAKHFGNANLSPLQFTALVKIRDEGRVSQNQLGRLAHTDPATIMGVMNRLADRELIRRFPDPIDKRRTLLTITSSGLKLVEDLEKVGHAVTAETLRPLTQAECQQLFELLEKIV